MKGLAIFIVALLAASAFGAQLVLQPDPGTGKDSHIRAGGPSSNYGTYQYLTVNWSPNQANRGVVEFTGLSAITKGSTVNSAKLELYSRYNSPRDYFDIFRITASWQEMTVTWSNQPAHYATRYATVLVPSAGTYAWDVKTLVNEWVQETHPNYGFKLIKRTESSTYPYFVSSDYGTATNRPKLTVDYTPSAIAPTSIGKVKALFK
jgi:hypothetical protein